MIIRTDPVIQLFIYGLIPFSGFKGFNFMLFYAFSLIYSPPYTIPLPLTGERDISFWRYGVRCIISTRGNKVQKISKQYTQKMIIRMK